MNLKQLWHDFYYGTEDEALIDHAPVQVAESPILDSLRKCREQMELDGIYAPAGYTPPKRGESVAELWKRRGWVPR